MTTNGLTLRKADDDDGEDEWIEHLVLVVVGHGDEVSSQQSAAME